MACAEVLPPKVVPPEAGPESFSHQLLPVDPQPEHGPQRPHLLEENGEDLGFSGTDVGSLAVWVSGICRDLGLGSLSAVSRSGGWEGVGAWHRVPGQLEGWLGVVPITSVLRELCCR